jgi:hypothetical protein
MFELIAELILQTENNSFRFENFCLRVVGKHEGVTYLPTSQSWDFGRDGRASNRGHGSHSNILCATLNESLDGKAEADLLRLTASASPDRIAYCSSQKLSELRCDEITAILRRHAQGKSIIVYGAKQLATIAKDNQDAFELFYGAEVQEIRSTILSKHHSGSPTSGLRLALLTFSSLEGSELRDEVLQSTLLDRLSKDASLTVQEISQSLSGDLGLPRALPDTYLYHALERAEIQGDVQRVGFFWGLTKQGEDKRAALPIKGVQQLLEGREAVRKDIEKLTGKALSQQQYETVWAALLDALSGLFHANGLEVISGINELLSSEPSLAKPLNLRRELENAMRRVVASISTADLREQYYTALLDLFTEREGPTFDWLARVSERFVALCSLGLEHESGNALRETLAAQRLVLDSDIILDFLCDAESDHAASRDLLLNWLGIGGRILVSPIVLEEVAHNAWISERDFRGTEMLIGKLQKWELGRYVRNPFVRTFHFYKSPPSKWGMYIGQFRGNSAGDYTKILQKLRERLKVEILPVSIDENLSAEISEYIRKIPFSRGSDDEQLEDVMYKINRDGKLLASLAAAREAAERAGSEEPIILLSSSNALRSAELAFEGIFQGPQLVLNKRSFSYLLSTVPQVSFGAGTLQRALFSFGSRGHLKSDGVRAMRLIRSTNEFDLPWADRYTFRKELRRSMMSEAGRRGISKLEMTRQFMVGGSPEAASRIIVEAIQQLAIPTKTQIELDEARRTIQQLRDKLAAS